MSEEFRIHFADEWTCYCGATFNNSDEYMLHLVEKKKKLMQSIGMDFAALNLLHPVKYPSLSEFMKIWIWGNNEGDNNERKG